MSRQDDATTVSAPRHALVPNTLGVACQTDEIRIATDEESLGRCFTEADTEQMPVTVVGGGSNLVLRSRLPGMVVLVRLKGVSYERLDAGTWRVSAAAGETWQDVVSETLGKAIGGLENLVLIPGSVGAAPIQNIGAYGRELAEVLESVVVFDRQRLAFETLDADECGFGYRDSRFKGDDAGRFVITRITMVLGRTELVADYPDVARWLRETGGPVDRDAVARAVEAVRRRKLPDPARVGNVGSFFKNPFVTTTELDAIRARIDIDDYPLPGGSLRHKIPAARLIDRAGWKGVRRSAVQVWPQQPLVLVNHGGATGRHVLDLARQIQEDVHAKYGVLLELEPAVLGEDS